MPDKTTCPHCGVTHNPDRLHVCDPRDVERATEIDAMDDHPWDGEAQ